MPLSKSLNWAMMVWAIGCLGVVLKNSSPVGAQGVVAAEGLDSALKRLDSPVSNDWKKSETTLVAAMKNSADRERATCALAIFHIKRGNAPAIANLSRQLDVLFPQRSSDLNAQLLRIQLWHALVDDHAEQATKHFSQLVESTLKNNLSKDSSLANANMLGTVVGMLECDAAQSPIDHNQLSDAKATLNQLGKAELVNVFSTRYKQAAAHAEKLAEWLQTHADQSYAEAERAAKIELDAINSASLNLDQKLAEIRLEKQDIDKQVRQMRLEIVRVNSATAIVEATWRKHPEVHNPKEPDRSAIRVPTTERVKDGEEKVTKYKYVTDKDGVRRREEDGYEWKTKYKTVRRPSADIERDIDRIYLPLLQEYQRLMAMRQDLLTRKAELQAKSKNLRTEISNSEKELDACGEEIRMHMQERKKLQADAQIIDEALKACQSAKPFSAFRPSNFEIVNYSAEKRVLVK